MNLVAKIVWHQLHVDLCGHELTEHLVAHVHDLHVDTCTCTAYLCMYAVSYLYSPELQFSPHRRTAHIMRKMHFAVTIEVQYHRKHGWIPVKEVLLILLVPEHRVLAEVGQQRVFAAT